MLTRATIITVFLLASCLTMTVPASPPPVGQRPLSEDTFLLPVRISSGDDTVPSVAYADYQGKMRFEGRFSSVSRFHEELAVVVPADKVLEFGVIGPDGEYVIEPTFDRITRFEDGVARAEKDGKEGLIDRRGKWVFESSHDHFWPCVDHGLVIVSTGRQCGVVTLEGEEVVPMQYAHVDRFSEGLARVLQRNEAGDVQAGYINVAGNLVVPLRYKAAGRFSDGMAPVTLPDGESGYIDRKGDLVLRGVHGSEFSEGRAAFTDPDRQGLRGYIDREGNVVIKPQYAMAEPFSEGLAAVRSPLTRKYGYIDRSGNTILEFRYKSAGDFVNGVARVTTDETSGYISKQGQWVAKDQTE